MGLCRGAAWGCAVVQQRGAAQGRSVGLRTGAVAWGCAGVQQRGAAQSSRLGRRTGGGGCLGAQRHGGVLGRSVRL